MPPTEAAAFSGSDLVCRRGGRLVFEAVSFAIGPGDALVLHGRNGSGKSSLLRLLAGFARPAAGSLAWSGEDIRADPAGHRCRLHYVGHGDGVKSVLSVRENLAVAVALAGGGGAIEAALAALDLLPLADTPGRFLSAGQRRRLALARLRAVDRPLWLLDEPGTGLDRASRERLEAMIDERRAAGGICVVATHGDVTVRRAFRLDLDG